MGDAGAGQTVGERIYLIREALGTRRDPMPLEKFAALIAETTGVVYDKSVLSRKETGQIAANLDDINAIAAVDPLKRGRDWLGWGEQDGEGGQHARREPKTPPPIDMRGVEPPPAANELYNRRVEKKAVDKTKRRPKGKPGDRSAMAG